MLGGVGLAVLARRLCADRRLLPAHPTHSTSSGAWLICGLGFGFFNTPNNRAILTSAPQSRTGGGERHAGDVATASARPWARRWWRWCSALFPLSGTRESLVFAACVAGAAALVSFSRLTPTALVVR